MWRWDSNQGASDPYVCMMTLRHRSPSTSPSFCTAVIFPSLASVNYLHLLPFLLYHSIFSSLVSRTSPPHPLSLHLPSISPLHLIPLSPPPFHFSPLLHILPSLPPPVRLSTPPLPLPSISLPSLNSPYSPPSPPHLHFSIPSHILPYPSPPPSNPPSPSTSPPPPGFQEVRAAPQTGG